MLNVPLLTSFYFLLSFRFKKNKKQGNFVYTQHQREPFKSMFGAEQFLLKK